MNRKVLIAGLSLVVALPFSSALSGEILFVDSYHKEYPWSAGITKGIEKVVSGSKYKLSVHEMDTKRNKTEEFKKQAAQKVLDVIKKTNPKVVIACDDNASKYVVEPYLKNKEIPVVFCGLNWDASGYGFPAKNVTGMVEVAAFDELVGMLQPMAKGDKVGIITADTATERKQTKLIKQSFADKINFSAVEFVSNMDQFKKKFVELQSKVDILLFINSAGIENWNEEQAKGFIHANSKIPSGAALSWMAPHVMMVFGKVAEEQGRWAAQTALQILGGKKASDIPLARNKEGNIILNAKIASKAGIELPSSIVEVAQKIIE